MAWWILVLVVAVIVVLWFHAPWRDPGDGTAVVCAIAKDEGLYIDEWVRYHLGLGFHKVYIYDNSDEHALKTLPQRYPWGAVEVVHFPGVARQMPSYSDFHRRYRQGEHRHTWCAFIDIDEFIVLKKHPDIRSFLEEHCQAGAIALNWYLFGSSGHSKYSPEPVLQRFQLRDAQLNSHVKCIVRLTDMRGISNPHHPHLAAGQVQRDTSGRICFGPFNAKGPSDVAVIHHYFTKSKDEFMQKKARGMADQVGVRNAGEFQVHDKNEVLDPTAWVLAQYFMQTSRYSLSSGPVRA